MYLAPLHPISNSHFYVSGNVTIHPSAAIAPGVLLQADPESQIIIGAGVCVGMGTVLHAHQGILELEEGANVGTGVLIIGKSKIGANACIGSMATILNSNLGWGEVVPPGSLVGDASRQPETQRPEAEATKASVFEPSSNEAAQQPVDTTTPESSSELAPDSSQPGAGNQVYGQANLNRLLSTLLPHRQALNRPLQDDQPSNSS